MVKMELVYQGFVVPRGKGSRAIPLPLAVAKLKGNIKVGDPVEIYLDSGEVIVRFPKPQPVVKEVPEGKTEIF